MKVFPAPLANVAKEKPDGSWNHRLIQDLKRNGVNRSVRLPERQALPRPVDHAVGMARLGAQMADDFSGGAALMVGIVDFADAFMPIPLDTRESC